MRKTYELASIKKRMTPHKLGIQVLPMLLIWRKVITGKYNILAVTPTPEQF
ncbi:hypothetical protein [Scytonema sp. HK-05]|uniref:hypothetical protein n=1 Tax=Scytonema sp. HK-05 TaxID=1137095 RepID=UPI001E623108|nr:hypothetical protein [Scytonema sp. HK-05]